MYEKIRGRDETGRLVTAGYRWDEPRENVKMLVLFAAIFDFMGGIYVLIALAFVNDKGPWIAGLLICVGIYAALHLVMKRFGVRPRAVIFRADGTTSLPFGIPWFRNYHSLGAHLENIVSIEAGSVRGKDEVALFTRGGDIVTLSHFLHPENAHRVAVQLTSALKELREDMASAGQAVREDRHERSVID